MMTWNWINIGSGCLMLPSHYLNPSFHEHTHANYIAIHYLWNYFGHLWFKIIFFHQITSLKMAVENSRNLSALSVLNVFPTNYSVECTSNSGTNAANMKFGGGHQGRLRLSKLGAVSIRKTVLPGMVIPMLKIRPPNGRLIFNMEIAIRR